MFFAGTLAVLLGTAPGLAAEQKAEAQKGEARKGEARKGEARKGSPGKRERIDCMVGTDDRQARIAIEALGDQIQSFAYYGKTKPRTCSMDVKRGNAYSKWEDNGDVTVVTLVDETGAFLIDHEKDRYRFIFREIDRMRYCGMEGKINGTLTVVRNRGKYHCSVDRLIIEGPDQ